MGRGKWRVEGHEQLTGPVKFNQNVGQGWGARVRFQPGYRLDAQAAHRGPGRKGDAKRTFVMECRDQPPEELRIPKILLRELDLLQRRVSECCPHVNLAEGYADGDMDARPVQVPQGFVAVGASPSLAFGRLTIVTPAQKAPEHPLGQPFPHLRNFLRGGQEGG